LIKPNEITSTLVWFAKITRDPS